MSEDTFSCSVCTRILREPCLTECGSHFCKACILLLQQKRKECPNCRGLDLTYMHDKGLERKLQENDVYCVNQKHGCVWTGKIRDIDKHLKPGGREKRLYGCDFVAIKCLHCSESYYRKDIVQHEEDCLKKPGMAKDLVKLQKSKVSRKGVVSFSDHRKIGYNTKFVQRSGVDINPRQGCTCSASISYDPDQECPVCLEPYDIPCLLECCGQHICQRCIEQIQRGLMPAKCPLCKAGNLLGMHDKSFERRLDAECENIKYGCEWRGKRGDLQGHLCTSEITVTEDDGVACCEYVRIKCDFCDEEMFRKDFETHNAECCSKNDDKELQRTQHHVRPTRFRRQKKKRPAQQGQIREMKNENIMLNSPRKGSIRPIHTPPITFDDEQLLRNFQPRRRSYPVYFQHNLPGIIRYCECCQNYFLFEPCGYLFDSHVFDVMHVQKVFYCECCDLFFLSKAKFDWHKFSTSSMIVIAVMIIVIAIAVVKFMILS